LLEMVQATMVSIIVRSCGLLPQLCGVLDRNGGVYWIVRFRGATSQCDRNDAGRPLAGAMLPKFTLNLLF
jgi:hypothetical protein